jgi:MFS superfamily sulfate permease-like transporter
MLQKLLTLAIGMTVLGHLFFRPQLKQLGRRIDRFVTVLAIATVLMWIGQLGYLLLTHR